MGGGSRGQSLIKKKGALLARAAPRSPAPPARSVARPPGRRGHEAGLGAGEGPRAAPGSWLPARRPRPRRPALGLPVAAPGTRPRANSARAVPAGRPHPGSARILGGIFEEGAPGSPTPHERLAPPAVTDLSQTPVPTPCFPASGPHSLPCPRPPSSHCIFVPAVLWAAASERARIE